MKERRLIIERWKRGGLASLITLVRAQGSSYRKPGARMLIGQEGDFVGGVSGGCLEAEMARKARWLTRGGAVLQRFSTEMDGATDIPFGLGCGGTLDLLLEPADTPEFEALMRALEASLNGAEQRVFTWLPALGGSLCRVVLDDKGGAVYSSPSLGDAERLMAKIFDKSPGIYQERLQAPQRLFVIGAGDDARPLVSMASLLGWEVLVADGRPQLAKPERFPEAARVAACPPHRFRDLGVRSDDAVVVMTHSYEQDREAVAALLEARPRYLGLLGARHRSALLLSEAAEAGGRPLASCCAAVHAPIGLDLGGDGPEAIALAIIAEAQACCAGKPSGFLRIPPEDIAHYIEQQPHGGQPAARCALEVA